MIERMPNNVNSAPGICRVHLWITATCHKNWTFSNQHNATSNVAALRTTVTQQHVALPYVYCEQGLRTSTHQMRTCLQNTKIHRVKSMLFWWLFEACSYSAIQSISRAHTQHIMHPTSATQSFEMHTLNVFLTPSFPVDVDISSPVTVTVDEGVSGLSVKPSVWYSTHLFCWA